MRLYAMLIACFAVLRSRARGDRGDVPGWVMVTLMSAVLVAAILAIFEPELKHALTGILDSVSGKN